MRLTTRLTMRPTIAALTSICLLAACGDDEAGSNLCIPGASLECSCASGATGAQVCQADGQSLGPCECSPGGFEDVAGDPGTSDEGPGAPDEGPGTPDEGPGTPDEGPGTPDEGTPDEGPAPDVPQPECFIAGQCDDSNPCTSDDCVDGTCTHDQLPSGTACGGGNVCDDAGLCGCQAGAAFVCNEGAVWTSGDCGAPAAYEASCAAGQACVDGACAAGCPSSELGKKPMGAECADDCECATGWCYDEAYLGSFRFCTRPCDGSCNKELAAGTDKYACLNFGGALARTYGLTEDYICQLRCDDASECAHLSPAYNSCGTGGFVTWDGKTVGSETCTIE